jgi:hypothetical protein
LYLKFDRPFALKTSTDSLRVLEKECWKMYRPQAGWLIVMPGMYATLASSYLNVGEASFQN